MTAIEKLKSLIEGLQLLLTFLEKNPTLADGLWVHAFSVTRQLYGQENKEQKAKFSKLARILAKGMGKKLEKKYDDYSCSVRREFNPMVSLGICTSRETVCERVVVGTKIVPSYYQPERTEEIVEWKCK